MNDSLAFLLNMDASVVERIYELYLSDPELVDKSWKLFFDGYRFAQNTLGAEESTIALSENYEKEFKVINLIEGYRERGHFFTLTNPVRTRRQYFPTLDIENFGLQQTDLKHVFQAAKETGIAPSSLETIISNLKQTYCRSIGIEYKFIREPAVVKWLQLKMESTLNTPVFKPEEKKHIWHHLKEAVGFEEFLYRKFPGQKSFSLAGAENLIPSLDALIEQGSELGISEIIMGMAHRGRLNILGNIIHKPYCEIFSEFLGKEYDETVAMGDVKYHLGYENVIRSHAGKEVEIRLVPNPSHLEAVGPVVEGITHALLRHKHEKNQNALLPLIIHGDAAVAAQGVVYETVQLSQLKGYHTGGTVHIVINNQVGFTTNYLDARSSTYCTDIAKVVKAPVFHVNGDDVEALIYTFKLAIEYRQTFHTDVFIDVLCYRKYGHNESDEPRFTQPILYDLISKHPNPRDIYSSKLLEEQVISADEMDNAKSTFNQSLEEELTKANSLKLVKIPSFMKEEWKNFTSFRETDFAEKPETAVKKDTLKYIAERITTLPEDKNFFPKMIKIVEDRKKMIENNSLDWAMCELLAYGSLVNEGHPVRLSGQDVERGTFSHRHSVFVQEDSTKKYFPLKYISNQQAPFHIYNSPLSEYAVLGFDYGYSLAVPNGLNIWEAQFGDFHNVAQVIIDQYISSAAEKWGMSNGIVLFLPHGYEGQGAEHSSARIERFLTLAANNNMVLANCSFPANLFHLLRRQVKRSFRLPLIVFTPKSLLRHPACVSSLDELANGHFQEVMDDESINPSEVTEVVFTSGRIYYDLLEKRNAFGTADIAILRIEQLYPFPLHEINQLITKYQKAKQWLWVQDEPENMGAWHFISHLIKGIDLQVIARPASGSPAPGLHEIDKQQAAKIIDKVFRKCTCELANEYCGLHCVNNVNS
jgi:2-oxoglutarate dehydrogenase E1 component